MIISASRRTDIPCYYADWFINRIKAGSVLVRNPMHHAQISRIKLASSAVDCIVFWTKDPANMLDQLPIIDEMGYRYYFQFTLTPYDQTIEHNSRDKHEIIETFIRLSETIGKHRVLWRYDPIIITKTLDLNWHINQFQQLCRILAPYTESVTISFIDLYKKISHAGFQDIDTETMMTLGKFIAKTAEAHNLSVKACCEQTDFTELGIKKARCIDKALIEKICGANMRLTPDKNQRPGCGCVESIDIGAYHTCPNGCIYCYANRSAIAARERYEKSRPDSELLADTVRTDLIIRDKPVSSCLDRQIDMFEQNR